ncbi:MAG: PaaI family thioesterase [Bacteroidales bacterium]|nr:PaaI family thioesterase [Bacteroidales bacterium]MCF0211951.1 PaaI family thioesterase [Bacteroidales bacterium]
MKKIHNGWTHKPGYNCFGCCPTNDHGLRMDFFEDGSDVVSVWQPQSYFQGWIDTLHGGIQATLCDEIASWVIFRQLHTTGVTAKLEVRYRKSISTLDHHLTLRARIKEQRRNIVDIEVELRNAANELCTTALATYFTVSPEKAAADGFGDFCLEEQ